MLSDESYIGVGGGAFWTKISFMHGVGHSDEEN